MDSNYRPRSDSSASERRRQREAAAAERRRREQQNEPDSTASRRREQYSGETSDSRYSRSDTSSSASRRRSSQSDSAYSSRRQGSLPETTDSRRQSSQSEASASRRQTSQQSGNSDYSSKSADQRSQSRRTVDYQQTATNDLHEREQKRDPRMRNAKNIRSSDSIRVLNSREQLASADSPRQTSRRTEAQVTGRSVRENRERRHAKSQPKALRNSKIIVAVIIILVLFTSGVIIYFSPAFSIKGIQVNGDWYLNSDRLTDLAQVPSDTTLLRVDIDEIAERIASDPWVSSVHIQRQFPSTLVMQIEERLPVAQVVLNGGDRNSGQGVWLLAGDGTWLGEVASSSETIQGVDRSQLVLICDVPVDVSPIAGRTVTDSSLTNALAIVNGFSPSMRSMISWISAPSVVQTTLYLNNNVEVAFGTAEDIATKEIVINQLIAEHGSDLLRINVRVADRPSIRLAK